MDRFYGLALSPNDTMGIERDPDADAHERQHFFPRGCIRGCLSNKKSPQEEFQASFPGRLVGFEAQIDLKLFRFF
jgi:hypothetical protein